MIIKARIKDGEGNTVAYDIMNGTEVARLNKDVVIGLFNQITNARLMPNGEFRANKGCCIDTIINKTALAIRENKVQEHAIGGNIRINFFGKEFINICRKIRRYARQGKVRLDENKHRANNGLNLHLFDLIDACGINHKKFITQYLSNIQPYCLEWFNKKDMPSEQMWLCDMGYKIKLVIKIDDSDKNKPLIVSFHESNKLNKYRTNTSNNLKSMKCAVIVDYSEQTKSNEYLVKYCVQRGFIVHSSITSFTHYLCNDVALVDYNDIKNRFDKTLNDMLILISNTYYNDASTLGALNVMEVDSDKLSFMSNGFATVNNIYFLIDMYSQYTDTNSRMALADVTLGIISELSNTRREEIKIALLNKFPKNYSNKLLDVIRNM